MKEIIRRLHPKPLFFDTSHGRIPLERFFPAVGIGSEQKSAGNTADSSLEPKQRAHSPQLAAGNLQLEKIIDRILNFPTIDLMPPDRLISAVYAWKGPTCAAFQALADRLPDDLVRGKGFIGEDGKICLFDMVMGKWELKPASLPKDRSDLINRIVFIGSPVAIRRLEALSLEEPLLSKESLLDPMEGMRLKIRISNPEGRNNPVRGRCSEASSAVNSHERRFWSFNRVPETDSGFRARNIEI